MNKFTLAALVALTQGMSLSSMEAQEDEPAMLAQWSNNKMPDVESLVCDLAKCWDEPTEPMIDTDMVKEVIMMEEDKLDLDGAKMALKNTHDMAWAATMQRCQRNALAKDWRKAQNLTRIQYQEMLGMLRTKLSGGKKATTFNTDFDTFNLFLARTHFRNSRRAQPTD